MKIFVTGAAGFIGGSVATRLVEAGHTVRGLLRDPNRAQELKRYGIEPVIGTLEDAELLTSEAMQADAVINAASSDHRPTVDTLVTALQGSGKILIHTSGTSIVADEARGEPSERWFDEDTPRTPEPDKAARVALDAAVLGAKGVRSIVLCNSLIYGEAIGPAARSVQLPRLIDLAQAIADALNLGAAQPMTSEDAERRWGREVAIFALGSNSRVRAKRAAQLGWRPTHSSATDWVKANVRP